MQKKDTVFSFARSVLFLGGGGEGGGMRTRCPSKPLKEDGGYAVTLLLIMV